MLGRSFLEREITRYPLESNIYERIIKELKYKIVGNLETDPSNGYISIDTPIAKAIIGKNEGEIVEVMTPSGKIELEIELVEHI